jgi:hypothetical protein
LSAIRFMKPLLMPASAPFTTGTRKLPAASRVCTSLEMKNLRKSVASFGEPLVISQPVMPPSVSVGAPLPQGTTGKSNQPIHGGIGAGGPDGEGQSRGGDQEPFQQSH